MRPNRMGVFNINIYKKTFLCSALIKVEEAAAVNQTCRHRWPRIDPLPVVCVCVFNNGSNQQECAQPEGCWLSALGMPTGWTSRSGSLAQAQRWTWTCYRMWWRKKENIQKKTKGLMWENKPFVQCDTSNTFNSNHLGQNGMWRLKLKYR